MKYFRLSFKSLLLVTLLLACTIARQERHIQRTPFSGYTNVISGKTSDGAQVSGIAWFRGDRTRGHICLEVGDAVCSGTYLTSRAHRISGQLQCSDRTDVTFVAKRVPDGDFVTPVAAHARFSDGRTAEASFSRLSVRKGTVICYQ